MHKASETEKKNREQLFRLMGEYPDLPVVPMVDADVVCDGTVAYWHGSLGESELGAYVMGDDGIYFRTDELPEDWGDVLNHTVGAGDWWEAPYEKAFAVFQNLPWRECIVVSIELPEVE